MFVTFILLSVAYVPCAFVAATPAPVLPVRAAAFLQAIPSRDKILGLTVNESREVQDEVREAMMSGLGCGAAISAERLTAAQQELLPTFISLPKNEHGRVDWRTLRYVGHRHFVHKWGIWIRGFDPSLQVSQSNWTTVDLISEWIASHVGKTLETHRAASQGFSLSDLAYMVMMLEQLILDSAHLIVKHAYSDHNLTSSAMLHRSELERVLESYLIRLVVANDEAVVTAIAAAPSLLDSITFWDDIVAFAHGQIRSFEFLRQHQVRPGRGRGALDMRYSFEDVREIVAVITTSFSSFWKPECNAAKQDLVALDTHGSGRVRLAKFYENARRPNQHFVFTDSEAYLRSLGALDESSVLRGTELIIPNYMQSASNCVVSTSHFLVCCPDECETILREIELLAGFASSPSAKLLMIVENLTSQVSLEDDQAISVDVFLRARLEDIESLHGGQVPLHGRLFAQWLHYVFPRDCPFPHIVGSTSMTLTAAEFGRGFAASKEEIRQYVEDPLEDLTDDIYSLASRENLDWMSQWSHEEHLFVGRYDVPSASVSRGAMSFGSLCIVAVTGVVIASLINAIRRLYINTLAAKANFLEVPIAHFI